MRNVEGELHCLKCVVSKLGSEDEWAISYFIHTHACIVCVSAKTKHDHSLLFR